MQQLSTTAEGHETVDDMFKSMSQQFEVDHRLSYLPPKDDTDDVGLKTADRQVAAAMQMLGQAQKGMHGLDVTRVEETGEAMMEDMMRQFEALGEKEDYNVRAGGYTC